MFLLPQFCSHIRYSFNERQAYFLLVHFQLLLFIRNILKENVSVLLFRTSFLLCWFFPEKPALSEEYILLNGYYSDILYHYAWRSHFLYGRLYFSLKKSFWVWKIRWEQLLRRKLIFDRLLISEQEIHTVLIGLIAIAPLGTSTRFDVAYLCVCFVKFS